MERLILVLEPVDGFVGGAGCSRVGQGPGQPAKSGTGRGLFFVHGIYFSLSSFGMFRLVCHGPPSGFRLLRRTRGAFFCSASPPRASGGSGDPSYEVDMTRKNSAARGDSRNADYLGQALDVLFLGTGSVSPTRHRSSPSLALRLPEAVWLFDCGENTQIQYQRAKLTSKGLRKVFITHLHGDHIFGLPGLLSHMNVAKGDRFRAKPTESGQSYRTAEENTVEIYGPSGLRSYLRSVELYTGASFCPYVVHELKDVPNLSSKRRNSAALQEFVPVWSEDSPSSRTLGKNEVRQGDDICANNDGVWEIVRTGECSVKAAALHHTDTRARDGLAGARAVLRRLPQERGAAAPRGVRSRGRCLPLCGCARCPGNEAAPRLHQAPCS